MDADDVSDTISESTEERGDALEQQLHTIWQRVLLLPFDLPRRAFAVEMLHSVGFINAILFTKSNNLWFMCISAFR